MTLNVVVTGANRGIGLAMVNQYLAQGHRVFALCRQASAALQASKANIIEGIDVSNAESLASLPAQVGDVDILINNAGILESETLGAIDFDTVARQFDVNAMGPLRTTEALLGQLKSGAKVALITSRMGSVSDNGSGGYYGYRMSKAALNAAGMSLAQDLTPKGVAVAILHPGFVQTDMVNNAGDISADTAAERLIERIKGLNMDNTGTFWHSNGNVLPW